MKEIDRIILKEKYNGPDGSGNGGYVSGRIASYITTTDAVEVTLRLPPPLGAEIEVRQSAEGEIAFAQGASIIATAKEAELQMADTPPPIDMAYARECAKHYPGFDRHPFPHCYVCGTERASCDGLRIYSGRLVDDDFVAAPFDTFGQLYNDKGFMNPIHLWAALDCPGSYAINEFSPPKVMVLGRITGKVLQQVPRDMALISMAWYQGTEGRKNYSGSCIYSGSGELIALARATWIEVDPAVFYNK